MYLQFVITEKHAVTTPEWEEIYYNAFMPWKGLDDISCTIRVYAPKGDEQKVEEGEDFQDGLAGYMELYNPLNEYGIDAPMLWVFIREGTGLFEGIDKMFTNSRIFNEHVCLQIDFSAEAAKYIRNAMSPGDKLSPEQWMGKHFPISGSELTLNLSHPYGGEKPVDFKKQREATSLSAWEISGYVWSILVGAFTIAVGFFLFSIATTPYENAVLAILVLIYSAMVYRASGMGMVLIAFGNDFAELFRLLHRPGYEGDNWKDRRYEGMKTQKKALINMYINGGSCFFLWIIAIWKLLGSILGVEGGK
jgi:hypothetical protein